MFAGPDSTSEEGAKWLQFAGHPPFFEALRFTYHPTLCDTFKAHIEANGETYPSLVQVVQQGGESKKKDMAPLYTDTKVLGQFVKKLLKSVGLNCAGDRGPSFHDMNFFYRVIPPVRQLALAMCLRATRDMTLETLF